MLERMKDKDVSTMNRKKVFNVPCTIQLIVAGGLAGAVMHVTVNSSPTDTAAGPRTSTWVGGSEETTMQTVLMLLDKDIK